MWLDNVAKASANNFQRVEDISQFNEDFTGSYNEESGKGYFSRK